MVPMTKKSLFFVFCYSFLSSSLFAMRPVPTLQELAARKFFREVSAAHCDLTDGTSIDGLLNNSIPASYLNSDVMSDYLKDEWKKVILSKVGLPTHVLPVSSNKENDDLLAFNFMSSKLMMACDPQDGTLFSLGKNAIKILSLVNGTYKKSALIDIPDNLWNDIVFNSKTKDLVIASNRQLLILKKDTAGSYTIHKQSFFPGKGSPVIDEETGDIFCIGCSYITETESNQDVERYEIYQWKRTEDGSYADPVVYFSSETMVHVQVLRDEVTHGCMVISWNKENNHMNLTVLEKDTGTVFHTFLYNHRAFPVEYNQILAVYGQEKGEFFIDNSPACNKSRNICRFYRQGNEFRQEAIPMNPRNIEHNPSSWFTPQQSMIYDHISRTFIYSGYLGKTIHGFNRDLGINIFNNSYRSYNNNHHFALKKVNNKLILLPKNFYESESAYAYAYIYNLGFEQCNIYKNREDTDIMMTLITRSIESLTWNQLILLEMIQKLARQEPTGVIELAESYRDDFKPIIFILSRDTLARCQLIKTAEPAHDNHNDTQHETSKSNDSDSHSDDEQSTKRQRVA